MESIKERKLNRVNSFITDSQTSPEFLEDVRAQGVKVIVANDGRVGTTHRSKPAGRE